MTNDRPIMEQFHEIHHILNQMRSHDLVMDEAIAVAYIIDKLPPIILQKLIPIILQKL